MLSQIKQSDGPGDEPRTDPSPDSNSDPFLAALAEWARHTMHYSFKALHRTGKDLGLSFSQLNTLFRMRVKGGLQVGTVSQMMGISNPAASQLLDDLVKRDLVMRCEDLQDRRIRVHRLTPGGENLVDKLKSNAPEWIGVLGASIPEEEKSLVSRSLDLLNARMRLLDMHKES